MTARKSLEWYEVHPGWLVPGCDKCLDYMQIPGLLEACASVGIEHGKSHGSDASRDGRCVPRRSACLQHRRQTEVSFMPNPGSLVRFVKGGYGIVVAVTPDGRGDTIVPIGTGYRCFHQPGGIYEIAEVIHEPIHEPKLEQSTGSERDS